MPSGVGAFHSGIEFGAKKYRDEQAAAAKLAGDAADDRRLNLNDFFARIGELEKALAPDKFDPQQEESLLAKAREIDRLYGDVTDLRATRMVLSRLGRKTPLTGDQKIGPIGDVPAPVASPNAGFPSAGAKVKYDADLVKGQQDAAYAAESGVLQQKWLEQIESAGGFESPQFPGLVANLTAATAERYGPKNAEKLADQMLQLAQQRTAASKERRLAEKAAQGKGIDPTEFRLTTNDAMKWLELSVLGGQEMPLTKEIQINMKGTQAMRATGQMAIFKMAGKGMTLPQITSRIIEMYGDANGVIDPIVPAGAPAPTPWMNTIPDATERQKELVRSLYTSGSLDATEWRPAIRNGKLGMVNIDTGEVFMPKTSSTVGVPDALKAAEPTVQPPVPLPQEPHTDQPQAPSGPPSALDRTLRGVGKGIEGTVSGIRAGAGGIEELLEMIKRGSGK